MKIKTYIIATILSLLALGAALVFSNVSNAQLSGGGGTIGQLEQWRSLGGYLVPRDANLGLKVPGLATSTTGCLSVASSGIITANGSACGSGSGSGFSTSSVYNIVGSTSTLPLLSTLTGLTTIGSSTGTTTVAGGLKLSLLNCSGLGNSGKLSVNASGEVVCLADISAGAPAWGSITGTPSDQTDLWAILDPKLSSTTLALFDKGLFFSTTSANYLLNASSTLSLPLCGTNEIPKWSGTRWNCSADATGGAPTWGSITGTLSSQTDLWSILDPKLSSTTLALFDKGFFHSTTSADYWETQQTARTADDLSNNTTSDLAEGTNLYFTVARVLSALTGQHVQSQYFTATGTNASIFPYASSTGISATTFWGALIGNVTGNVSGTAGSLAANGADCSAGSAPLGVDQAGAVESCFDVWTEAENTSAAYITASALSPYLTLSAFYATTTQDIAELGNLYWTDTRFDNRLSATGTLPNLYTLTGLATVGSSTGTTTLAGGFRLPLNCSGFSNSGKLTANASGEVICDNDTSGSGSSVDWTFSTNYGVNNLTPSSTMPLWARGAFYASSTAIISGNTSIFGTLDLSGWTVATTTVVCAACEYTSIQTALTAGYKDIQLKAETYAGPVSVTASDTTIRGAGMNASLITCNAATNALCVSIATSSALTRITLEDFGIDNTNATKQGTGLDTSDTTHVKTSRIRITDFGIGHLIKDTVDQSFYSTYQDMVYFDVNNCLSVEGSKVNQNEINHPTCRVATPTGYGYKFTDAEGWLLLSPDSEPNGTGTGTALYIDGTSIGITAINPWFEGNGTGTEIISGAINTKIIGGRITANTVGVWNRGIASDFDNVLVTSNTTNINDTGVISTWKNPSNAFSSVFLGIGTSTARTANTRLGLGISSSSALDPMLILNNAGAFAAAYSGLMFDNSTGGFPNGIAKIGAEPGTSYTDASLKFHVADASKVLQERGRFNVSGFFGLGTTSPYAALSVVGSTGVVAEKYHATGTATSTFAWDINIASGHCIQYNGTCITLGGGLSGGTANMLAAWTGASSLTATATPQVAAINATSTTDQSTFAGTMSVGGSTIPAGDPRLTINNGTSQVGLAIRRTSGTAYSYFEMFDEAGNPVFRLNELGYLSIGAGMDVAIARSAAGILEIMDAATVGQYRDLRLRNLYGDGTATSSYLRVVNNLGVGTSSPYAALSIVGSTGVVAEKYTATGTATSTFAGPVQSSAFGIAGTWFVNATQFVLNSIAATFNAGVTVLDFLDIPSGTNPTVDTEGETAINTTSASSSLRFHDGTAERTLTPDFQKTLLISTSTVLSAAGAVTGTTTIRLDKAFLHPITHLSYNCRTTTGNFAFAIGDGSATTSVVNCTTTGTTTASMGTNASFILGDTIYIDVGALSANNTVGTLIVGQRYDAD